MPTANLKLSKFDLKGNTIFSLALIATAAGSYTTSGGITTDKNDLFVHFGDGAANSTIYKINKKKVSDLSWAAPTVTTKGVETNEKDILLSTSASTMHDTNKKGVAVRTGVAVSNHYVALTRNKEATLGVKSGALTVETMSPKDYSVRHTITLSAGTGPTGISSIRERYAIIDSTSLNYFDYAGNLKKTFSLPAIGSALYKDVCHDGVFLWVTVYEELPDIEIG